MKHYPASSRPARIEGLSITRVRRGPSFLVSLLMAVAAFATGIACCAIAHQCGFLLP